MGGDQGLAVRTELFGTVFVLVQNLSRRVDVALRPLGLTSRQWLLLAVLQRHFPGRSPSLTEAAAAYGSSRQNVKRIAEQLARRGYLELVADPADRRPTRLRLTERGSLLDPGEPERVEFLLESMAGLDDAQLEQLRDLALTWLGALAEDGTGPPSEAADEEHPGEAGTGPEDTGPAGDGRAGDGRADGGRADGGRADDDDQRYDEAASASR